MHLRMFPSVSHVNTCQLVRWITTCQTPEIGEGDAITDVIDVQLGVYKADTVCTLGRLSQQYLRYRISTGIYGMVYVVPLLK